VPLLLVLSMLECHAKSSGGSSDELRKKKAEAKQAAAKQQDCLNKEPTCAPVTASVFTNVARPLPCEEETPPPCMVVVNDLANTTALCAEWSSSAFWDGAACLSRCDALGGVLTDSGERWCLLEERAVVNFDAYVQLEEHGFDSASMHGHTVHPSLFMAPIRCGTWIGVRESARADSWYAPSPCSAILENPDDTAAPADVSPCGIDRYTAGCRVLGAWVPECRGGGRDDDGACGVPVPCPEPNPCMLDHTVRLNVGKECKASRTYLALNTTATPANCHQWTQWAFVMPADQSCVSSCGVVDYQCTLPEEDGEPIPVCGAAATGVCAVPMPSNAFTGVRNGFFGISRAPSSSSCEYSTNCSADDCVMVEGVNVSKLADHQSTSSSIPLCRGNLSEVCKIEYPCPAVQMPFQCHGDLHISRAIYTRMGVYNCTFFIIRDWSLFILVICAFVTLCSNQDVLANLTKWLNLGDSADAKLFVLFIGVALIWVAEFVAAFVSVACLFKYGVACMLRYEIQVLPSQSVPNTSMQLPRLEEETIYRRKYEP
jgi:hypothetical protein